jgi:hypothetical protein
MSMMKIEKAHSFTPEEAKKRLEALGDYLRNKHGLQVTWSGDRASFSGRFLVVTIKGTLSLQPNKAVFEGEDPGFLWRGKAKDYIESKLRIYLDSARKLEELKRS